MTYDTILARSFSKHDQKTLRYCAFVVCLIIALSIFTVFKPALNPIPSSNFKVSIWVGGKNVLVSQEVKGSHQNEVTTEGLKSFPEISKINSLHVQTDESQQKHHISKPMPEGIQREEINHILQISKPKSTDVQTDELNPVFKIPMPSSTKNQTKEWIRIPSVPNQNSKNVHTEEIKPICNTSMYRTDVCEMRGDTRIDGKSSTVFFALPYTALLPKKNSWKIKPYARKEDKNALRGVREFKVKMVNSTTGSIPRCTRKHNVVGIMFSNHGYSGNHFHDFTDTIIPLYITSIEFNRELKFVVTNHNPWWMRKYRAIFQKLSKYKVIDIDKENEIHCFPNMIVGLKRHKELGIDPSRSQRSMKEFRKFLREAYSLNREKAITLSPQEAKTPRLLIISRRKSRAFLNIDEIVNASKKLGFEVIVAEADSNEGRFAETVNSCDVMMGVHGAGLTNILYLPEKAVFIQVLGLGNTEWLARTYFGEPSKSMNLQYLEYQIGLNESSLIQQYPLDHPVLWDPASISRNNWRSYKEVYMEKQNIKLDMGKFRGTLQEALKLLHL